MGISAASELMREFAPNAKKIVHLKDLKGKKIAVDASIMIYSSVIGIRESGSDLVNANGQCTSHLYGVLYKTLKMLECSIIPVFVFDGKAPDIKEFTLAKRRKTKNDSKIAMEVATSEREYIKHFKNTYTPYKDDIDECKMMLDIMGIPYIQAPGEADIVCAWLSHNDYVDGVATDDFDTLLFGAKNIYKNMLKYLNKNQEIIELVTEDIINEMQVTKEQLIDISISLGCDYCGRIGGFGPKTAYSYIKKYGNLEGVLNYLNSVDERQISTECYLKAKEYIFNAKNDITTDILPEYNTSLSLLQIQSEEFIDIFMCDI
jgi:flap endonuclease-1